MNKSVLQIIKAGLLVGTLDILAAFLYYFVSTGNNRVSNVLKFIASGLFGKEAFTGGAKMIVAGLLLHYIIAFAFTLFFFWLSKKLKTPSTNSIPIGMAYGVFIWIVMNLVVLPLSSIGSSPFNVVNAIINLLILVVCVGIPLSVMDSKFRMKGSKNMADS